MYLVSCFSHFVIFSHGFTFHLDTHPSVIRPLSAVDGTFLPVCMLSFILLISFIIVRLYGFLINVYSYSCKNLDLNLFKQF